MLRIIVAASLLPLTAFAASPTILPGLYEVTTKTNDEKPEVKRHCVTAAESAKGIETPPMEKGCRVLGNTMAGGKMDFRMACPDMSTSLTGSYSSTSYTLDSKIEGKMGTQTLKIVTHATGKRIADACKPTDE
jgi:hypothetical protein